MKKIFRRKKRLMAIFLGAALTISVFPAAISDTISAKASQMTLQNLDYTDSLETRSNPERGFYRTAFLQLKPSGNAMTKNGCRLVHLRVDLSPFSSNATINKETGETGESIPLTKDALQALEDSLQFIKDQGNTVIIRTCYDTGFNGNANFEPDQELILTHLKQLGEVYTKYKDTISYVELGTFGPWGEMHSSKCCTGANVAQALDTLLSATPDSIKIGVRNPWLVAAWLNLENPNQNFDITSPIFQSAVAEKGDVVHRVGMFNDGYLGSDSDLGTFSSGSITRERGVAWLNEYAKTTLYGGEVVADFTGSGSVLGPYNSISYLSKEGFLTHTSYLNYEWNYNVINAWKEEIYTKEGDPYDGQTAFKYVEDHLGYRFVLKKSQIGTSFPGGHFPLHLEIDNVGFGNIVNSKKVSVILKSENGTITELACDDINPCEWYSKETTSIEPQITLPETLPVGTYDVYLRISEYGSYAEDNNYLCIQFANKNDYWNTDIGANYIGKAEITDKPEEPTISPDSSATPTPDTSATPVPDSSATPMPDTSATPVPDSSATPTPDTSATPAPDSSATPMPDTSATPAPDSSAIPTPDTSATPAPDSSATPTPDTSATPVPDSSATPTPDTSATPVPDSSATPTPDTSATSALSSSVTSAPNSLTSSEENEKNTVAKKRWKKGKQIYRIVNKKKKTAALVKNKKKKGVVRIPAKIKLGGVNYKVTIIDKKAFYKQKKLRKIILGKNIKKIKKKAFYGCKHTKIIYKNKRHS